MYGAGAVGGVVGARLHQGGHEVLLIARGAHGAAIARDGLVVEAPEETATLRVPVVATPDDVDWSGEPAVLLAVKGQHTMAAMEALVGRAPPETPVVCAQNGVENERLVLRHFANTYAMCVMCATTHLRPGRVEAHYSPVTGLLDLGRFPAGEDELTGAIAAALRGATFGSVSRPDIMRWKYRKLLLNLSNAVEALCGPGTFASALATAAVSEGEVCLRAAGIDVASVAEEAERRRELSPTAGAIGSIGRVSRAGGGSTWQSLARGAGSVEADFLNGEIVLLGRLNAVATPVNALLQRLTVDAVRSGAAPGLHSPEALLRQALG